jgi:hypothetical protein
MPMPFGLSSKVIPSGAVVAAGSEAAPLEIYGLNRKGKGRFFQAFPSVPYRRRGPSGKPRFTRVSEGKPRRRLLLGTCSNSKSILTIVLLCNEIGARHITRKGDRRDSEYNNLLQEKLGSG